MSRDFAKRRLEVAQVVPEAFLAEFCQRDAGTRRFLLNALTLFAAISPEQQHQAINDLIQSEIFLLAEKSLQFLQRRVKDVLYPFHIAKELEDDDIREYYYRYYMQTGQIPERLTPEYLNVMLKFIVGVELLKTLFRMSFMEQQRFFEIQGKYSTQALLFYRYIKPIRRKLARERVTSRDPSGTHYYQHPKLDEAELMDYIFDIFDLETIVHLGEFSEKLSFESDYIYAKETDDDRDVIS
ncbi:MAG: hypothetical protein Fur0042_21620 [Cyanophyceae cyanobacterium]